MNVTHYLTNCDLHVLTVLQAAGKESAGKEDHVELDSSPTL